MIFWLILPLGLIVGASIVVALFLLGCSLFHSSSDQQACIEDDGIVADRDPFREVSENVASLIEQSNEEITTKPVSANSTWLPPNVRSEPTRSSQAIICSPPLLRSPYASSFNQQQEHLVAAEYERLALYKHGVQINYDKKLNAIFLVFTDFAFRDMKDIQLYRKMIYDDTSVILKEQGLETIGVLADLSGLCVAGDITSIWGQEVRKHVDIYSRSSNGDALFISYFSQAVKDDQAYIKRKKMEVQMQTEAVKNHFHCNMCMTKEEAVACYRYLITANPR